MTSALIWANRPQGGRPITGVAVPLAMPKRTGVMLQRRRHRRNRGMCGYLALIISTINLPTSYRKLSPSVMMRETYKLSIKHIQFARPCQHRIGSWKSQDNSNMGILRAPSLVKEASKSTGQTPHGQAGPEYPECAAHILALWC